MATHWHLKFTYLCRAIQKQCLCATAHEHVHLLCHRGPAEELFWPCKIYQNISKSKFRWNQQTASTLPSQHHRDPVDYRPMVLLFREYPNHFNVLPFAEERPAKSPTDDGVSSGFEVTAQLGNMFQQNN